MPVSCSLGNSPNESNSPLTFSSVYYYISANSFAGNASECVSMNVESESGVSGSTANPYKEILGDNFRFTKTEKILFALEMVNMFSFVVQKNKRKTIHES